jgi:sugar phosphate isomerase/epimerase
MNIDVPSGAPARVATPHADDPRLARLSLNQWTVQHASVAEAAAACVEFGLPSIGLWRQQVADFGIDETVKLLGDNGLRVSSLCRGGFFTTEDTMADNRRAVDETATLGAGCLVLVAGGLPEESRDLAGNRARVAERIAELAPYAERNNVRLAIEPLHPMFCADRAVVSTLSQALDIAEPLGDNVGVVVDAYHVWWDPQLYKQIRRAGKRIFAYQICDWILPLADDPLLSRGMIGDGVIDLATMTDAVLATGYAGDIEVEIFNADVWSADPRHVVATVARRYVQHLGRLF